MKQDFRGFYSLGKSDFSQLWEKAIFIFDTNVLLNFYRYRESTTEQLLKVLEFLDKRIWIPYHVALEYQRNRLKVIATQNSKFSEVRKIIDKGSASLKGELNNLNLRKRHSNIEPENFIAELDKAVTQFIAELNEQEKLHFSVIGEDKIRNRLDTLLEGKIGPKPPNQKYIDDLEKEAEIRFKHKIPPGYMDDDKDKTDDPIFSYSGLIYQRKYSDYIVWKQIISFTKEQNVTDLIFITDDNKEDWWLKIKQNGEKTISPRPELIGEITQESNIERFHIYRSEEFLKYANELLSAGISKEAIEEVRDVARVGDREYKRESIKSHMKRRRMARSAEKAVYDWLASIYEKESLSLTRNDASIDIVASLENKTIAFEIKVFLDPHYITRNLENSFYQAQYFVEQNKIDELVFIYVVFDVAHIEMVRRALIRKLSRFTPLKVVLGVADLDEDTGEVSGFIPHNELTLEN